MFRRLIAILTICLLSVTGSGRAAAEENGLKIPRQRYSTMAEKIETMKKGASKTPALNNYKPPLSGWEIIRQYGGGMLTGIGVTVSLAGVASFFEIPDIGASVPAAPLFGWIEVLPAAAAVGFPLGNSIGIFLVGRSDEVTGSYLATLAGSTAGALSALGLMYASDYQKESYWAAALLPSMGGIIGFNATRRYRDLPADSNDQAKLMCSQQIPISQPGINSGQSGRTYYFNLLNIDF